MKVFLAAISITLVSIGWVHASAASDWAAIEALDSGPKRKPNSKEEAVLLARNHLLQQRNALLAFLKTYPSDSRAPAARVRLAEVYATEGNMDANARSIEQALKLLNSVESDPSASAIIQSNAAFRRASILMQSAQPSTSQGVKTIVSAAREFVSKYPSDIRAARILVEAATVCDEIPSTKRGLLEEAKRLTTEELLLLRIADDLARLDRLGKPLELSMPTLSGGTLDLSTYRGKPVLLIFWSSQAPQSLLWLRDFRLDWEKLGSSAPQVVTVSLDTSRKEAAARAKSFPPAWAVGYEEGGWESPTARKLGINALPTIWSINPDGTLESLNARSRWKAWISSGVGGKVP